jgi:hypothetical protein
VCSQPTCTRAPFRCATSCERRNCCDDCNV